MNALVLIFGLLMGLVTPADAKNMSLDYRVEIAPAAANGKSLKVEFVDARGEWAGTERLGHVRAGAGIPYSLHNKGVPIETLFTDWLQDSMKGAGYTIDPGASETARVTLEYFWIEGYMVYDVHMKLRVDLVSDRGVLASHYYDRRFEERLDWTVNELNKPINTLLQQIGEELVGASYAWDFAGQPIEVATLSAPVAEVEAQPEAEPLVVDEPVMEEAEELPDSDPAEGGEKSNKTLIIVLAAVGGGLLVIGGGLICCCCLFSYAYY